MERISEMNSFRFMSIALLLALTMMLSACTIGAKKDANFYATEACSNAKGVPAMVTMVNWSKARQLDSKWDRAANAHTDSQVFKAELDRLSQYLDNDDPQFREVELNWSRAGLILISECSALKLK
jgi:hypothetical protein